MAVATRRRRPRCARRRPLLPDSSGGNTGRDQARRCLSLWRVREPRSPGRHSIGAARSTKPGESTAPMLSPSSLHSSSARTAGVVGACLAASVLSAAGLASTPASAHSAARPSPRSSPSSSPPSGPPSSTAHKDIVRALNLDIHQAAPLSGYTTFANSGNTVLSISVVTDDGGLLLDGRPRINPKVDRAVRTPQYTSDPSGPHAVIQVLDRRGTDDLDPGAGPFRFGADFNLDAVSEDSGPGGRDNGDNLIQRGLFNQQAQYKIQLDHDTALCRVKGSL